MMRCGPVSKPVSTAHGRQRTQPSGAAHGAEISNRQHAAPRILRPGRSQGSILAWPSERGSAGRAPISSHHVQSCITRSSKRPQGPECSHKPGDTPGGSRLGGGSASTERHERLHITGRRLGSVCEDQRPFRARQSGCAGGGPISPDDAVLHDYAARLQDGVTLRLLTTNSNPRLMALLVPATIKWNASHSNRPVCVRLAASQTIHDRIIAIDGTKVWIVTQSLKDLAAKAPATVDTVRRRPHRDEASGLRGDLGRVTHSFVKPFRMATVGLSPDFPIRV